MNSCILAFDIGTSAVKASLVSPELKVLGSASQAYQTRFPAPQYVEQDARDWWSCAVSAARSLFESCPDMASKVAGIGVSGHMLGLLPVDSEGNPLTPSMIHADNRAMAQMERVQRDIGVERIYSLTGNVLSPAATLCKAMWLKDEHPELYAKTARFLQAKDYLNYRLTGNMDATDLTDASHAMLIDIREKKYMDGVFAELGMDGSLFPVLHRSADVIGRLSPEAAGELGLTAGIPVAAGGGDGSCASVGAGIGASGDVYCSLGTTAWISCNMDEPYVDDQRRVFNLISLDGVHYGAYGTVQCAGRSVNWAQKLYVPEGIAEMNRLAGEIRPGSEGLIFLPYLEGERTPMFDALARGVFFGVRPDHDRRHFARAVFEGVSFGLAGVVDIMRERMDISEMRIIGGGAKSALWRQIIADAGRVKLRGVDASADAATSIGAAAAAGTAIGMFSGIDEAARRIAMTDATSPNPELEDIYADRMELYQMLYPALKPAFHRKSRY